MPPRSTSFSYQFSVPNLPPSLYQIVKTVRQDHGVSQWHVVIAAILALTDLEPEALKSLVDKVRSTY